MNVKEMQKTSTLCSRSLVRAYELVSTRRQFVILHVWYRAILRVSCTGKLWMIDDMELLTFKTIALLSMETWSSATSQLPFGSRGTWMSNFQAHLFDFGGTEWSQSSKSTSIRSSANKLAIIKHTQNMPDIYKNSAWGTRTYIISSKM